MPNNHEYGLDDVFTFGKYRGNQVEDVVEDDPNYIEWLVSNDVVSFDDEALELITKKGIC